VHEPRLTAAPASTTGSATTGRASSAPTSSSEKAVRAATAASVSNPALASNSNCSPAPAAAPPGKMPDTALPARSAVTTENHWCVCKASRCRAKVDVKEASSATSATASQTQSSVTKRGQDASTRVRLGSSR
jgi:hypothetical protein